MSRWRDWDYKKDVIEDNFRMSTRAQGEYIQKLCKDLGRPRSSYPEFLSHREAAALIHDLHLEWLRERGDAK